MASSWVLPTLFFIYLWPVAQRLGGQGGGAQCLGVASSTFVSASFSTSVRSRSVVHRRRSSSLLWFIVGSIAYTSILHKSQLTQSDCCFSGTARVPCPLGSIAKYRGWLPAYGATCQWGSVAEGSGRRREEPRRADQAPRQNDMLPWTKGASQ